MSEFDDLLDLLGITELQQRMTELEEEVSALRGDEPDEDQEPEPEPDPEPEPEPVVEWLEISLGGVTRNIRMQNGVVRLQTPTRSYVVPVNPNLPVTLSTTDATLTFDTQMLPDRQPWKDIDPRLPFEAKAVRDTDLTLGESVIIGRATEPNNTRNALYAAHIVTVSPKPIGYVKHRNGVDGLTYNLDVLFAKLPAPVNVIPSPEEVSGLLHAWRLTAWVDHYAGPFGEKGRASTMPESGYGRGIAHVVQRTLACLCAKTPAVEKRALLNCLAQYWVDLESIVARDPLMTPWHANGGHGHGRLPVIVFFRTLLGGMPMTRIVTIRFAEVFQFFAVTQADVDNPHVGVDTRDGKRYGYTKDLIGRPEWGNEHFYTTSGANRDNGWWDAIYRRHVGAVQIGSAAALKLVEADLAAWGLSEWERYMRRFVATERKLGRTDAIQWGKSGLSLAVYDAVPPIESIWVEPIPV